MQLKDYYQILELEPGATLQEVKKAYRKLAHQNHPDKNNNDPHAAALFTEIKEAYEILTDPAKKEYYLQQRWYHQSLGKKSFAKEPATPPMVLKSCLELNRYVASLDIHRMDRDGLTQYIREIFSTNNLQQLEKFNEPEIDRQIIISILDTMISLKMQQAASIATSLFKLAGEDIVSRNMILDALERHRKKEKQEKYKPLLIIIITILICLLIYVVGR